MKIRLITLAAVILVAVSIPVVSAQDQPPIPPLPADLLFTSATWTGGGDFPRDVIVRVDAETLEVSPFYVDEEAFEILPLSWSPQGDLLAIYRVMPPLDETYTLFPRQLCVLNRDGVLQRCMHNSPPMHWGGDPQYWQSYFPVAWGAGGLTIYFMTEYVNENSQWGYGRRLVEVSVTTGETLQVIYDYPDPYPITPSSDRNYATVGFGGLWYGPEAPAFLVNLTTGAQMDILDLIPENIWLSATCWSFSPGGQFFTACANYDLADYAPELEAPDGFRDGEGGLIVIWDMQGSTRHIVGEPEGSPAVMWYPDCPGWQPDEQAIVFYAWSPDDQRIMRYSLADQQTTTLYELSYEPGHETYVYSPLIPSPDGAYIALTVSDGPYDDQLVAVLYPDGEIYRIPSPYRFGLYPLWVPPLIR